MYIKIHKPKTKNNQYNNNKGSCSALAQYLEKENLDKALEERDNFFNQSRDNVGTGEVIERIDNNKANLCKKESKFYMLTINPSEKELKHIAHQISGRNINSISDFTKDERTLYETRLKEYARDVMNGYAQNFNRGLNGNDLVYFGKLEHERKYGRDVGSNVLNERKEHIKISKEDAENIEFNKYYYADSKCRDVCHGLKKGDKNAIRTAAAEMVKNIPDNAVLVPMPSSCGYATYTKEMCEEIKKLNPTLDVSDILKCNERQKLFDLKKEGKEASSDFFNFHLSGTLPKGREVYMVDNVLATGSTYVNAKEIIPEAKLSVYGINEDTKIKLAKIEQMANISTLNLPKAGDLKAGLQSHIHIIVSRKDVTNSIKLSPLAKAKNSLNQMPNGDKAQIGFNRVDFTESCEQKFDQRFDYKRGLDESFKFHNTLKNKLTSITKDFLVPQEYAQAFSYGNKAYRVLKSFSQNEMNKNTLDYLAKHKHILNQTKLVADSLNVNSQVLKYEIVNNEAFISKIPQNAKVRFNELNNSILKALEDKKEVVKPLNESISKAHSKKDWKTLKKLKVEKLNLSKPFDETIRQNTKELDSILTDAKLKPFLSSEIRNIDQNFYNNIGSHQKLFGELSNELNSIHNKAVNINPDDKLSAKDIHSKLSDLRESNFRVFGIMEQLESVNKDLDSLKTELYKSLRTIEGKKSVLEPALYGKSLDSAKLDVLFKIDVVNRCQKDIKYSKGMLAESAKVVINSDFARDPINIAKQIFSQLPVGRECMQAIQYAAAPQKALLDLGKKAITSVIQAGMGI